MRENEEKCQLISVFFTGIEDRQVLTLSIPFSDIQRLTIRPIKWLLFVTFAVGGARGDLSETPNGPPVNYDSITLAGPIAEDYYYIPQGNILRSQNCYSVVNILFLPQGNINSLISTH